MGHQFNLNSTKQLSDIFFVELKLPHGRKTKTGYSVDAEVLESLRGQHAAVDTCWSIASSASSSPPMSMT